MHTRLRQAVLCLAMLCLVVSSSGAEDATVPESEGSKPSISESEIQKTHHVIAQGEQCPATGCPTKADSKSTSVGFDALLMPSSVALDHSTTDHSMAHPPGSTKTSQAQVPGQASLVEEHEADEAEVGVGHTLASAKAYCNHLSGWSIRYIDTSRGSLYCIKAGVTANQNCNNCATVLLPDLAQTVYMRC